jgi:hypothetical protein
MFNWLRRGRSGDGPDYSEIDSAEKADILYQRGELKKILLLPAEFGGQPIPPNVVYLPPFAAEQKAKIDLNVIKPLIASGKASRYRATPEYQGRSFIPIKLTITATEPGSFTASVAVWGGALRDTGTSA